MSERAGRVIDQKWEILEPLGHGGMSETYKARDVDSGRVVVLKMPHASIIGDPATFSRYEREMKVGQRLTHPHIQKLIAAGVPGRGAPPYMVLEYIDGTLLRTYLAEHGPLPTEEAIDITTQLTEALEYCHRQGVVHRDLKPENVLITPDGQAKLVDFGIALLQGARRLTFGKFTSAMGTPDYMASEQVSGERGDARTDIYAIGVMLYEMLTGDVPFQGDNALSVMGQRTTTDPPRLTRKRDDISPQLEAVAYRALARDPAQRYQSMESLQHDLEHLDQVEPLSSDDLYKILSPRVGPMPSWRMTAVVVASVFAILLTLGFLAQALHRASPTP